MPVPCSLVQRGKFDTLEFLAALPVHIPKTYESITRYYGRYSSRRRGERAKLPPPPPEEQENDYRREFRRSSWAACIKRIYEIDPLECSKCKAQMRIISFTQDAHLIKDIMKVQGIPDFQAPPSIPKFIDAVEAINEPPPTTPSSRRPMTAKARCLRDGTERVRV
jgi:hypothetical protein